MRRQALASGVLVVSWMVAMAAPAAAARPAPAPQTLSIGVDWADPANQQPNAGRVFEYTDFFSRNVRIHSGDTLDFHTAPASFHIVALARSEEVARRVYPVALADVDHDGADIAAGSGVAKVIFGPSNFPITGGSTHGGGSIAVNNGFGPPVCGVAALGEQPCTFRGGDDIEVIGPTPGFDSTGAPAFVDQLVHITAAPGEYDYFCFIHPGMRGQLNVVDADDRTTSQSEITRRSAEQFEDDRAAGLDLEHDANHVTFSGDAPGSRTYLMHVGVGSPQSHVAIDEMLPNRQLNLAPGDRVRYVWSDRHNVHSVAFPANSKSLPEPFGFDCGPNPPGYIGIPQNPGAPPPQVCVEPGDSQPESIGDPGNAAPGTRLTSPAQLVDAGIRIGTAYDVHPSSQSWSVATDQHTSAATYQFQCTVHDWMQGTLKVS
jgi:plastocyanin